MDIGRPDAGVSLDQRREQIYSRINSLNRDLHMRGPALALRALLEREDWTTPADEYLDLDGVSVNLFDAMRLVRIRLTPPDALSNPRAVL